MEAAISNGVLAAGAIEIRPEEFLATVDGRPLNLTARELDLLTALVQRAGRIVSREELYRVVWHEDYRKSDRSVDVYVAKLRQKLESAKPDVRFIHTHFGFGYRLQQAEERSGIGDPASTGRLPSHGFHIPETSP
jgi:DNA-binding response OmpR family regulator